MLLINYLFISFILTVTVLIINIVIAILLYLRNRALEKKQKYLYKHLSEITESAREKAEEIIENATKSAGKTLAESIYLKKEFSTHLKNSLEDVMGNHLNTLRRESENFDRDYKEALADVKKTALESTEAELQKEIKSFREVITEEIIDSHKKIESQTLEEMAEVNRQMEAYKAEQIKLIESQINQIIQKMTKEIIGKSLSLNEHQDIVMEALEKAKKEGAFR